MEMQNVFTINCKAWTSFYRRVHLQEDVLSAYTNYDNELKSLLNPDKGCQSGPFCRLLNFIV